MEYIIKFIKGKLQFKVNHNKGDVLLSEEVTFFGCTFGQNGRISVSMNRLKQKIVKLTNRNLGLKFQDVIKNLNLMIQGWGVY